MDCILKGPFKDRTSVLKSVTYCEKNIATTVVSMSLTDLDSKLQIYKKLTKTVFIWQNSEHTLKDEIRFMFYFLLPTFLSWT